MAGGILGGSLIGAGLYAAYQAIKYRGMRMVCNHHADVAWHLYNMSTGSRWKLFDEHNKFNQDKLQQLLQYFQQESDWDVIPQADKNDLVAIYRKMKANKFTCEDTWNILRDVSQFHEEIAKETLRAKRVNHFNAALLKYLHDDMNMQTKKQTNLLSDTCFLWNACYGEISYSPFCIRYRTPEDKTLPVPLHAIAYVARYRCKINFPYLQDSRKLSEISFKDLIGS